ncbi:hypothetical protein BHE74_00030672 [Ensete ventricosum]|nr:hypothetical protein GW17_00040247 [Ensete ventricosum]RWW62210.1 hypothetical protein BHE74_00030672 [Ensete ventricosum]RZS17074.1 hypothetical protein BHM03_00049185 [Ensete ventricosum]
MQCQGTPKDPTLLEGSRPTLQSEGKTRTEVGGTISRHPSCLRRDLHSINNRREDTPSDLTCVEFEKVLCLE